MLFVSCRSNTDTPQTTPQQTEPSTPEVTTLQTTPEKTSVSTPEETSVSTPEETSVSTPEETSVSTPEETSVSTPEETSVSTPEETSVSTPEETSASTPEETSASTPEETPPEEPPVYDYSNVDEDNVLKRACIITGESENERYAGEEMAYYLQLKNVELADDGFPIIIFFDPALIADSFFVDVTLRGEEASMTIRGGGDSGALYGVYHFLEQYAGVRYFTPTLEKIPEGDIVLWDGNMLAYEPYFEYRHSNWYGAEDEESASWNVKVGMNGSGSIPDVMGGKWNYGPLFVHTIGILSGTGRSDSPNPCLSDPNILRKVIQNVRSILRNDPSINIVSISQNDNYEYCTCEKCAAVDKEEGSPAGLLLRFVNAVAENLEKDHPNLVIDTLAYRYTQKAPRKTVPRHNVCVRVCPINCCFSHPITECKIEQTQTQTRSFLNDFMKWSKICDRIYVWDYTTNFRYYVPTFPNFGSLRENMRFYVDHNVKGMFSQGNYESVSGEFAELRIYLLAKLMWDPYMSEEEYYAHMDEFLEAYYGAGWEGIRKYIDKTTELAQSNCMSIYSHPFEIISKENYLANEADFEAWWSTAESLAGDRKAYVKRSRLQWRYIRLMLHPNTAEAYDLWDEICWYYDMKFAESWQYNKAPDEWYSEEA